MLLDCFCADATQQARIKHFHKRHHLSQPLSDEHVWVAQRDGELVGVARLVPCEQACWLRGLYILPNHRQKGIASALITQLQHHTHANLYAFAQPTLQHFYQQLGFILITPDNLSANLHRRFMTYQQSKPQLQAYYYQTAPV
ncbi:MAG: GNAT family N-acetyltransferase [Thiomicrospira sp.]|jgi:N-acetylglutamate synthase-like GNAT family acetyltransferase|nr:GNAT family N-acetyltransferase [Thiomicrospira sp.]